MKIKDELNGNKQSGPFFTKAKKDYEIPGPEGQERARMCGKELGGRLWVWVVPRSSGMKVMIHGNRE